MVEKTTPTPNNNEVAEKTTPTSNNNEVVKKTTSTSNNNVVVENTNKNKANNESNTNVITEQNGTAGSNISLKDDEEEAKYQIKIAMQNLLEETYGNKVYDARIYVDKIYSTEEEQKEPLKSHNIGIDDVAFDVHYELKPANGVDPNEFTAGSGYYDEESEWITEKYSVGILRKNESGEPKYKITDFETGW